MPKVPVISLISSRPHVPAFFPLASAQFRKNLWPLRNHRLELGFWGSRKSFRNWGPGDDKAGLANQAGLPAITATLKQHDGGFWTASGAITVSGKKQRTNSVSDSACDLATFDASLCSSIYGRANTVMPASVNQPVILYLGRPT